VTWQRFCKALGKADWAKDPAYATNADRKQRRDKLNPDIEAIIKTRTSAEWVELLQEQGVPCGPIYRIDEMFEDPQVQHLGIAEAMDTEAFGKTRAMAQPVRLERTPSRLAVAPPGRGEHADELLQELGLAEAEIADLRKRSIV